MTRVLIAAGGTAGHVVPALAVADELRSRGADVVWLGGERSEADLVPAAGYPLHQIAVKGLSRSNPLAAARAAALAGRASAHAARVLRAERPDAVFGGGGYVAGPAGVAAVLRRVPLVLSEADSVLGLTNRLLARFAKRVCLAFPIPGRDGPRYRVTGRPVPPPATDRAAARADFGVGEDEELVLVFGGSLGARSINMAAVEAFAGAPFHVLHVSGQRDHAELLAGGLPRDYDLRAYLPLVDFADALAAADLVVARSGGSVFEIAAHARPAVLIPYPHAAGDHQNANARWMADAGAAVVIPDPELTAARLGGEVAALLSDRRRLAGMASAAAALARPDAARDIARELLEAASG
jgi:UDP-N-acetylglucosamine--N-acetylmuramyl-(pentapeptide) pyrophosphoryl-undecaprenol N-acetylglucosamine transferase